MKAVPVLLLLANFLSPNLEFRQMVISTIEDPNSPDFQGFSFFPKSSDF